MHAGARRWTRILPGNGPVDQGPRTHKIVDGDTLPALAERYLGSADPHEIFAANRDVLSDPELLPYFLRN